MAFNITKYRKDFDSLKEVWDITDVSIARRWLNRGKLRQRGRFNRPENYYEFLKDFYCRFLFPAGIQQDILVDKYPFRVERLLGSIRFSYGACSPIFKESERVAKDTMDYFAKNPRDFKARMCRTDAAEYYRGLPNLPVKPTQEEIITRIGEMFCYRLNQKLAERDKRFNIIYCREKRFFWSEGGSDHYEDAFIFISYQDKDWVYIDYINPWPQTSDYQIIVSRKNRKTAQKIFVDYFLSTRCNKRQDIGELRKLLEPYTHSLRIY